METLKLQKEKGVVKKRRKSSVKNAPYPSYEPTLFFNYPTTLPLRDLEVFTVTTIDTVRDYIQSDMATPRDPQFAEKILAIPIPNEGRFTQARHHIDAMLTLAAELNENPTAPYILSQLITDQEETFWVLQMRQNIFPHFILELSSLQRM